MRKLILAASVAMLALTGCSGGESGNQSSTATAIKAPDGGDWSQTAVKTPEGGMRLGNPDAPVKLIEFGSLTCSHCADFDKTGKEPLMAYIKKGTVSYEFRTFLLNAFDLPASLLARCNGPAPFFPIASQLFAAQRDWLGKASQLPPDAQRKLAAMDANQSAAFLADGLGLVDFVGQFGVSADQAKACLADPKGVAELEAIMKAATEEYQISGTPTFIINNRKVENAGTWQALEPEILKAGG